MLLVCAKSALRYLEVSPEGSEPDPCVPAPLNRPIATPSLRPPSALVSMTGSLSRPLFTAMTFQSCRKPSQRMPESQRCSSLLRKKMRGFGTGVNRRIAPFLGEWSGQVRLECQPWVGGFLPVAIPSVCAQTPAWRGTEQGIPEEPETASTQTRWLEPRWLKLTLLRILISIWTGCACSSAVRGWLPFWWCKGGVSVSFKYSLFK